MSDWSHLNACIGSGLLRVQSSVKNEKRIKVMSNAGTQAIDLAVYQTLNPPCDCISVRAGLTPSVPIIGLLSGQEPPLYNEFFDSDTNWSHDGSWVLNSGAIATASSTLLSQSSPRIILGIHYLMVAKVTRTAGSVAISLGSTAFRTFSATGVYALTVQAAGTQTVNATPTAFTGTINYICCIPITSYLPCNSWLALRYSKLAAVGMSVNLNLDTTPGSGLWVGYT